MMRTIALALLTIALSGCVYWMDPGWISESGRRNAVGVAADAFGYDLRWGRVAEAALALEPESRAAFIDLATNLHRQAHFTSFEVQSIQMGPAKGEASVEVAFQLYPVASQRETTFHERQQWRYDLKRRRWLLTPNLGVYQAQLASTEALRP